MAVHPPDPFSDGGFVEGDAALGISPRRWARTIIRARMRSPRRNCSRCSAVYGSIGLSMEGSEASPPLLFICPFLVSSLLLSLTGHSRSGGSSGRWPLVYRCPGWPPGTDGLAGGLSPGLYVSVGDRNGERYPSEGVFIDATVSFMQMDCQPVDASAHDLEIGAGDVRGQYTKTDPCTCCTSGRSSKLAQGESSPYWTRTANTFCLGPVATGRYIVRS